MTRKYARALLGVAAALSTVGGLALFASPALAAGSTGQSVTGLAASNLSLAVGVPAAFGQTLQDGVTSSTNTAPGVNGTLVVTDTNASPTLSVQDQAASNPGHMQLVSPLTCTGSTPFLASALSITDASGGGFTYTPASPTSLSSSNVQVASAAAPVAAGTVTEVYSQGVGSSEVLQTGCSYSLTATYTLG